MNNRLSILRIGDQILFQQNNNWFTEGYYQLREVADLFGEQLYSFTAFGRIIKNIPEQKNFYEIPTYVVSKFKAIGPEVSGKGLKAYLIALPKLISEVKRALREHDVNWIMMPSLAGLVASLLAPKDKIKVVQLVGEWSMPLKLRYPKLSFIIVPITEWLTKLSFKKANLAVFVSNYLYQKYGNGLKCKVVIANESRLRPYMIQKCINYEIHIPLRILYVGRLVPEKGVQFLFQAVASVDKDIPVELGIVGSGPFENYLREIAKNLGIEKQINWYGWIPWGEQLFKIMREYDVFVLPSYKDIEGLPLVLIEAMSQGLVVIASKVGGIPEIVKDGISGLLVEPGDSKAIAESIIKIARDSELRKRLVSEGLKVAKENTLENQTGKVVSAMLEIIERHGGLKSI
jgi:glycosyltransferase involved in cell wall biosynthesis